MANICNGAMLGGNMTMSQHVLIAYISFRQNCYSQLRLIHRSGEGLFCSTRFEVKPEGGRSAIYFSVILIKPVKTWGLRGTRGG